MEKIVPFVEHGGVHISNASLLVAPERPVNVIEDMKTVVVPRAMPCCLSANTSYLCPMDFTVKLNKVLAGKPFLGNQRQMALTAGIDPAQLYRVLKGQREPSPRLVGRIAAVLTKSEAKALVKCYLRQIAAEVSGHQQKAE